MTGGAFRNSSNLLSRRREIEEFEKTVKQLQKRKMEENGTVLRGTAKRKSSLLCSCRWNPAEASEGLCDSKYRKRWIWIRQKNRIRILRETSESVRRETDELDQQITDISNNQESITVELDTSTSLEEELTRKTEEAQEQLEAVKEEETRCQKISEEVHLAYASLEQKNTFILENIERIQEEIAKFEEEKSGLGESKEDTSREIREKEEQIADIRKTIEDSKELFWRNWRTDTSGCPPKGWAEQTA